MDRQTVSYLQTDLWVGEPGNQVYGKLRGFGFLGLLTNRWIYCGNVWSKPELKLKVYELWMITNVSLLLFAFYHFSIEDKNSFEQYFAFLFSGFQIFSYIREYKGIKLLALKRFRLMGLQFKPFFFI